MWHSVKQASVRADLPAMDRQPSPPEPEVATTLVRHGMVDELVGSVAPTTAWRWAGVFALVWVVGSWVAGLHTHVPGVRGAGGVTALGAAVLSLACGYVAVRAWQVRRSR